MSTDDLRALAEAAIAADEHDSAELTTESARLRDEAVADLLDKCTPERIRELYDQRDELQRELAALRAALDPKPFSERAREWMRARGLAVGDGAPSFIESTITTEFAAVAASERERCAKVCDERTKQWDDNAARANVHSGPSLAAAIAGGASSMDCAAAIRALPEPGKEG